MKKILCLLFAIPIFANAQSFVASWDFNTPIPLGGDATVSTGTLNTSTGLGNITLIGGSTSTFATGNISDPNVNDNSGLNTTNYPAQGTNSKTAGIQVDFNATGYSNINVSFWQRLSNTAANTWTFQYTLDASASTPIWVDDTTFTFVPQATGTGDTWHFRNVNLSDVTGLSNNPNAAFRVVSAFDPIANQYVAARSTSTYAATGNSTGTSRFDLFYIFESKVNVKIATASNFLVVNENAGTINVPVTVSNANHAPIDIEFSYSTYGDATVNADFNNVVSFNVAANTNGVFNVPLTLIDDTDAEMAERIVLKLKNNGNTITKAPEDYIILYIKDNDFTAPTPTNELNLTLLSSFSNGPAGPNSAEISAFDTVSNRLYIVNSLAKKLEIVNFNNPAAPVLINSIDITSYGGGLNSVVAYDSIVAIAIENVNPQTNGSVLFLDYNGNFISQVEVGAMPDMITFNKDYTKILTANEGEPNTTYTLDPEGSVSIIDLTPGYANLTNANVTQIGFTNYNGQENILRAQGIRVFTTSASVAQDFEPEYITISNDNSKAYVSIQENNALLVIDLSNNSIDTLIPLGYSSYGNNNGMDASDQSGSILITGNLPVKGAYMPDAIAYSEIGNTGYVFTANEGDSREFGAVIDANRISSAAIVLDTAIFKDQHILKNNKFLGRLNALKYSGDTDLDGDLDEIHTLGARSFSIFNAQDGQLVFDSKALIEQITSTHANTSAFFNASNSTGPTSLKNRSDDKGPEPEGVTTAYINNSHYLFVSLERIGGVMAFNVDNPVSPVYVGYYNNRTLTGSGPDLGAEGILFIPAEQSPNGNALMILSNEVSSTLSIYQINTCTEQSLASLQINQSEICEGQTATLTASASNGVTFEWFKDQTNIPNETSNSLSVNEAGQYTVKITNNGLACSSNTNNIDLVVNPKPMVNAGNDIAICQGQNTTLNASGANAYTWNNGVVNNQTFTPNSSNAYIVEGVDNNGCTNKDTLLLTVNPLPNVMAGNDQTICNGETLTLAASGANTYTWNNGVINNQSFTPTQSNMYIVEGTDNQGCSKKDTLMLTINPIPSVNAGNDQTICLGESVTLTGSGALNYTWNNSVSNNVPFSPTITTTYQVTGTDNNGCIDTDNILVTVEGCAGINEIVSSFKIYPNPTNGIVNIETIASNYEITIFSLEGKLIEKVKVENQAKTQLELNHLPKGVYYIQLNDFITNSLQKIILE